MRIRILALGAVAVSLVASAAVAAPVITQVGADLSRAAYTFGFNGAGFTFGFNGDYFGGGPITVSTLTGGEVNTVFGQPTTNFTDRGTVSFGPDMQYAAFDDSTAIRFTNGDNFIGLRAVNGGGDAFYGFAYTTNNVLNSYGFETRAGTAITATTASAIAAVPEPASWAMMIGGFALVGGAMRRRRTVRVAYAA